MLEDKAGYKIGILLVIIISPPLFLLKLLLFPNIFVCPYLVMVGDPCLFCGTSRSLVELFKGNLLESIHLNIFGILTLTTYIIILISSISSFYVKDKFLYRFQIIVMISILIINISGFIIIKYFFIDYNILD